MRNETLKLFAISGLIGSFVIFLRGIQFFAIPTLTDNISFGTMNLIFFVPIILELIGLLGVAQLVEKYKTALLILIGLMILYYVIFLINPFYVEPNLNQIRRIIFAIPILFLFYNFWNIDKVTIVLFILEGLRFLNFILQLNIGNFATLLYSAVLVAWFYLINNNPDRLLFIGGSIPTKGSKVGSLSAQQTPSGRGSTDSVYISQNFPSQLVFWCNTCNQQKKGIKVDFSSNEAIQQKRKCPSCDNWLLQFWAPTTREQENKMIIGVSLFTGGMITNIIGSTFFFSVLTVILATLAVIVGAYIAYTTLNEIKTVSQPPSYAKELPSLDIKMQQTQIMINFGIRISVGGILIMLIILIL